MVLCEYDKYTTGCTALEWVGGVTITRKDISCRHIWCYGFGASMLMDAICSILRVLFPLYIFLAF